MSVLSFAATTNCTALTCNHFCVSTATGAKCICSEGFVLNATDKICYGKLIRSVFLTLYRTILTFSNPYKKGLLKTLWEKEKMLVNSIFFFSHSVFFPVNERSHYLRSNLICCLQMYLQFRAVWKSVVL